MIRRFKLEFEVVLDADAESVAIARARESYGQLLEAPGNADPRLAMLLPEDFIQQADEALLQLFDANPLLSNSGTLTGTVDTTKQKNRASSVARKVKGVKQVQNNLLVGSRPQNR